MAQLTLHALVYSLSLWMGLYLLQRNDRNPALSLTGVGLVSYAIGLAVSAIGDGFFSRVLIGLVPLVAWALAVWHFVQRPDDSTPPRNIVWLLYIGSAFFLLSLGALVLPIAWLLAQPTQLTVGVDLLIVGYAIAKLDAHNEGEALLPGALQSLITVAVGNVILGAQVLIVMAIDGTSTGMVTLLFGVLGGYTLLRVFSGAFQAQIDKSLLAENSAVQSQRDALHLESEALARTDARLTLLTMPADEFTRHTRRALRDINRPDKLMANPLMQLPFLDADPDERPLVRAGKLRTLLIQRIEHLKPDDGYGTTDAWRYYNALYYPYVVGLKPYSRRFSTEHMDEATRAVFAWMQTQVPERTLYNWQNAAAKVIADDLRASLEPHMQPDAAIWQ